MIRTREKLLKKLLLLCYHEGIPFRYEARKMEIDPGELKECTENLQNEGLLPSYNLTDLIIKNYILRRLENGRSPMEKNPYYSKSTLGKNIKKLKERGQLPNRPIDDEYARLYRFYVKNNQKPEW